ncbi:hypothetical protein H0H92_012862 [Tricholoma furcatifolium]|nr:hypothetical protein H0H92_012862 [Tricholoma furcatifolium]
MPQQNQHKPCPPDNILKDILIRYYNLGLDDNEIAQHCQLHFDTNEYSLSLTEELQCPHSKEEAKGLESDQGSLSALYS